MRWVKSELWIGGGCVQGAGWSARIDGFPSSAAVERVEIASSANSLPAPF